MTYIYVTSVETSSNLKTDHGVTTGVVKQLILLKLYIFLDIRGNLHIPNCGDSWCY